MVQFWRARSLRGQLVIGVCATVSVALLVVGALSIHSLRTYVTTMGDAEVARSLQSFGNAFSKLIERQEHSHGAGYPAADDLGEVVRQGPDNLIAVMRDGDVIDTRVFSIGDPQPASAEAIEVLEAQSWADVPRTVQLPGLGSYRVLSHEVAGDYRLISGIDLDRAHQVVAGKAAMLGVVILIALVAASVGTALVVRHALKPLRRVAATAAQVAGAPLDGEDNRVTAWVRASDTDPESEVGIVGEALNRLLTHVDSTLVERAAGERRIRQFLTDVSHELRTPLTAIQGYAELTRQDSAALPPTTEYACARIEAEAQRLTVLVTDLLLLSRLDEGQDLEIDEVDLGDLICDAVNDAAVAAPEYNWVVDVVDGPVRTHGDRVRLHQVVSNLLNNAHMHNPPGTTVTTTLRVRGAWVELDVTDDGPDIDSELLPNLFARFVRADRARSRESGSTGLGLAIVASIVGVHGGTTDVQSGGGHTTMRVRLPLIAVPEAPRVTPLRPT